MLTIGSLFAGYGGLDMGISSALDARPAWFSEVEAAPSKILAHHWPDVPNHGDVTKIDWHAVEPVDIITGGSPCQDLSHAGKRAGMRPGTRSGLWAAMHDAITIIRPRLVVWENVRGALSAEADSELEHCPGCMGDGDDGPVLRALGRVLGDLADIGYDANWYGLRAADVGAAHGRFRIFLFAQPADSHHAGLEGLGGASGAAPTGRHGHSVAGAGRPDAVEHVPGQLSLLPTPVADNSRGLPSTSTDYASLANVAALLPTPAVNDMGAGKTVDDWDAWTDRMKASHGNGNGHGKSLSIEAQRLLPTPRATDGTKGGPNQRGSSGDLMLPSAVGQLLPTPRTENNENRQSEGYGGSRGNYYGLLNGEQDWREYEPAIRRQEAIFGRPAPAPTELGRTGKPRLSPRFCEWLMGLPEGWVTDPAIGLTRNQMLKALGNGVVPAQAAAAFRQYLTDTAKERAA